MQEIFEFIIPEGKVVSNGKGQWTLQDIEKEMIKTLHPQLYDAIDKRVQEYYANKELNSRFDKALELNKFMGTAIRIFKSYNLVGYELDFPMSRSADPDMSVYIRSKDKVKTNIADIYYDRYCHNNKPWVKHYNFKRTRYGSLDSAFAAVIKNIKERQEEIEWANKVEKLRANEISLISKELGFKSVKDTYYRRGTTPYRNNSTEKVIAVKLGTDLAGVDVHLHRNDENSYSLYRIKINTWSFNKIPAVKMIKLLEALKDITEEN